MGELDAWIYEGINNGVYMCGFAQTQQAYDAAIDSVEKAMDKLEHHLSTTSGGYLMGDVVTLSDVRLFVSLIRFDEVYHIHFKCHSREGE